MCKKPPIGLKSFCLYKEEVNKTRVLAISRAMKRYSDSGYKIPKKWVNELQERLTLLFEL